MVTFIVIEALDKASSISSSFFFCLAEDVISRDIAKLVSDGKLDFIKGTRTVNVSSHTFYVDEIMVFCKGSSSNSQSRLFIYLLLMLKLLVRL
jgi:hypothetical protein